MNDRECAAVLFVAGLLAFNYPLLALFDRLLLPLGVPLLYGYLFLAWLGLIVAAALCAGRRRRDGEDKLDGDL